MVLGFTSGLPFFVLISLIPIWLRTNGVDLKTIGFLSALSLPYSLKFLWAPLCDGFFVQRFGRRKTWMLGTQMLLMIAVAAMAFFDPVRDLSIVAAISFCIAVFSATQDIAIDAYRRELLSDQELGFGTSVHVNFYRVAQLVPGSLALILADLGGWSVSYLVTAAFLLPGIAMSCLIREPQRFKCSSGFRAAVTEPFREFVGRKGVGGSLLFLLFLFAYKLGDSMATALISPFYADMGFTTTQIGTTAKFVGLSSSVCGAFLGGILMIRIGINRALWFFGFVQIITILGFALLTGYRGNVGMLAFAVFGEYLGVGLGTACFIAFIARATNPAFTATQFALFSAVTALPRVVFSSVTGIMAETLGWFTFFCVCYCMAIPGMLLLLKVAPFGADGDSRISESDAGERGTASQTASESERDGGQVRQS